MSRYTRPLFDALARNALNKLVFAIAEHPTISPRGATGGWNPEFLAAAFDGSPHASLLAAIVNSLYTPVDFLAGQSAHGISGLLVSDIVTGRYVLAVSGTELNAAVNASTIQFQTLGADVQIATGIVAGGFLASQRADILGLLTRNFSATQIQANVDFSGLSSGGWLARDLAEAFGVSSSRVSLYQAPGELGLFGSLFNAFTFGLARSGPTNFVISTDLVPNSGLGGGIIYLSDVPGLPTIASHGSQQLDNAFWDRALQTTKARGFDLGALNVSGPGAVALLRQALAGVELTATGVPIWTEVVHGQLYQVSANGGAPDGFWTISALEARIGFPSGRDAELSRQQAAVGTDHHTTRVSDLGEQVGQNLGSSLGVLVGGENPFAQVAAGTLLGAFGAAFGQWLDYDLAGVQASIGDPLAHSFGEQLGASFRDTGISVISSQLTNALMNALGLSGFGAQLGSVVVNTAITNVTRLLLQDLGLITGVQTGIFSGLQANIAAFFGSQLANLIVSPQTQAASILGSLGSIAGSLLIPKLLMSLGYLGGPVGAFVGTILGTLVGNLFGHSKPRIPTASAEVFLEAQTSAYVLGASSSANAGDLNLVRQMASAARDSLNNIVAIAGHRGDADVKYVGPVTQTYGQSGQSLYVRLNGTQVAAVDAIDAVNRGVLWAAQRTVISGGDIFVKRALQKSTATTVPLLMADLQVAQDYSRYRDDWRTINAVIAANPNSAFTAGWVQTFQRVNELGLGGWTTSDFNGGLRGFLDSFDVPASGTRYEDMDFRWEGGPVRVFSRGYSVVRGGNTNTAAVERLWDAGFGWHTDQGSIDYWVPRLDDGQAHLEDIANGLLAWDAAYYHSYDSLTNAQFVTRLYNVALRRQPGVGEIDGWVASLDNGATRASVFVGISESDEHKTVTSAYLGAGNLSVRAGEGLFTTMATAAAGGREVVIDDLARIGYTGTTPGATTSGNDFIDWRGATWSVTLDDWRQEQTWVWGHYENGILVITPDENDGHWETLTYTGGDDIFIAGSAADTLYGRDGDDWLDGREGTDTLLGQGGRDTLIGGAGVDYLAGGADDDYLSGGAGDEWAWPDTGQFVGGLWGGAGNDTLVGGDGQDTVFGEDGDDILVIEDDAFYDRYEGDGGSDTASFEKFTHAAGADMRYPNSYAGFWSFYGTSFPGALPDAINAENISGSAYNDWFCGDDGFNIISGMAGDDILHGWGGDDVLEGGSGADEINGEDGLDIASYAVSLAGVYVDMSTWTAFGGDAEGDTFSYIEGLRGSKFADEFKGDSGANRLEGGDGDDWIVWSVGGDTEDGQDGADTLDFSQAAGSVYIYSNNTAYLYRRNGDDVASNWNVEANAYWQWQGDVIRNVETYVGSAFGDVFVGSAADETFVGGVGTDVIYGYGGSDTYVLDSGGGLDYVYDDNSASNTLAFGSGVTFTQLWHSTAGGSNGYLALGLRDTTDEFYVAGNFGPYPINNKNIVKTLDFNGASQLDVGGIDFGTGGSDSSETIYAYTDRYNFIIAYSGDDVIYADGNTWESKGNIVIGDLGDDTIVSSIGDDQYAMERGHGHDTIYDAGGSDVLAFGPTVAAEDVIYKVVGNDLYIGVKEIGNAALEADQVSTNVRIVNGGVTLLNPSGQRVTNTIEYVQAGGTWIDLRKLDINWTQGQGWWGYAPPIVLDLGGDGLDLVSASDSDIVIQNSKGGLSRVGWIGGGDGILAFDRNGDGSINQLSEITFSQDRKGATTDLEGLSAWDTNGDGLLDKADEAWGKLLIWTDRNQNGRSTKAELQTLEQAGIEAIDLKGLATGYTAADTTDNYVAHTLSFKRTDGTSGDAYDVMLARRLINSDYGETGQEGYRDEWGNPTDDGQLGKLTNDAKAEAKLSKRGGVTTSYDDVKRAAKLDFSDNDTLSAKDRNREADRAARKWSKGSDGNFSGSENLDLIRRTVAKAKEDELTGRGGAKTERRELAPVVFDLNGDGASLRDAAESGVASDLDRDGVAERLGWVGADDAMLALDRNGDGSIQLATELSFLSDKPGATTQLDGLGAFDENADGVLTEADSAFGKLLLWQDRNQDGVSQADELVSLRAAGFTSLALKPTKETADNKRYGENQVLGQTTAQRTGEGPAVPGATPAPAGPVVAAGKAPASALMLPSLTVSGSLPASLQMGFWGPLPQVATIADFVDTQVAGDGAGEAPVICRVDPADEEGLSPVVCRATDTEPPASGEAVAPPVDVYTLGLGVGAADTQGDAPVISGETLSEAPASYADLAGAVAAPVAATEPPVADNGVSSPVSLSAAAVSSPADLLDDQAARAAAYLSATAAPATPAWVLPDSWSPTASTSPTGGWWRGETGGEAAPRSLLGEQAAAGAFQDVLFGPRASSQAKAAAAQQQLRQSLAGFGGDAGASAPVWTHGLPANDTQTLAAHHRPSQSRWNSLQGNAA